MSFVITFLEISVVTFLEILAVRIFFSKAYLVFKCFLVVGCNFMSLVRSIQKSELLCIPLAMCKSMVSILNSSSNSSLILPITGSSFQFDNKTATNFPTQRPSKKPATCSTAFSFSFSFSSEKIQLGISGRHGNSQPLTTATPMQ